MSEKVTKARFKAIASKLRPQESYWWEDANCKKEDVSLFVYGSEHPSVKSRKRLEQLCKGCKASKSCLLEAIRNEEVGWWGGMDESERMEWAVNNL